MSNVKNVKKNTEDVKIDLGGRERSLIYDMNAFAELENRFGSIGEAMDSLTQGKIGHIRTVLWAGLIHDEVEKFDDATGEPIKYGITPYTVGSWIKHPSEMAAIAPLIAQAVQMHMPNPEDLPDDVKAKLKEAGVEMPGANDGPARAEAKNA